MPHTGGDAASSLLLATIFSSMNATLDIASAFLISPKSHSANHSWPPTASVGRVESDAMDIEIGEFLAHLIHDRDRAPNTIERYREVLEHFAAYSREALGCPTISPDDVGRRVVEVFVRHGGRSADTVSAPSTRNVRLAALRGLFGYLTAEGRLARDPTVGLESVKVKSNSPGYLTEAEFGRLLAAVETTATDHYVARDFAIITVMLNCGLRISETLSLDLAQVNFEALRFHAVMRKGRVREDVVMNHAVADALRRWLLYRKAYRRAEASSVLFLSDRGRRLSARAVQRAFAGYIAAAGLKDRHLTPHSLRHSCATLLVSRGVGIETVAEILNHRKLDTTRLYVRILGRQKQEAVALLDRPGTASSPTISPASPTAGPPFAFGCLTDSGNGGQSGNDSAQNGSSATDLRPRLA